jgi:hypothetical protein
MITALVPSGLTVPVRLTDLSSSSVGRVSQVIGLLCQQEFEPTGPELPNEAGQSASYCSSHDCMRT